MRLDLSEFAQVHNAWQRLNRSRHAGLGSSNEARAWGSRFAGMQLVQAGIAARGQWTHGHSDLMAVLGIGRREVANCRVLTWLLDPLARHGIGAGMIAAFGEKIGVELVDPHQARAEAEVGRTRSRADVVLTGAGGRWTVVIEAKVGAGEGPEQGYRLEQDWLDDDAQPNVSLVFLTTGGKRLPLTAVATDQWVPMAWQWFADSAAQLLAVTEPPPNDRALDARHAVEEWVTAARRSLR